MSAFITWKKQLWLTWACFSIAASVFMKIADLSFLVCSMLVIRLTWYFRLRATFSRDGSLKILHETVDQSSPLVLLLNIFLLITLFHPFDILPGKLSVAFTKEE